MSSVLILGGGSFVGDALARDALARGWDVTCLSRGVQPLAEGVRALVADRLDPAAMTSALAGVRPDLVADTWAGAPRAVVTSARQLAGTGCRYGYVSTRSVYAGYDVGADESAAVVPADPDADTVSYPADKRGGELAAERELGADRVAFFRAGAILGPRENVGRGPWWLSRIAQGGTVLAPAPAELQWQYVDVRDLAAFVWDCLAAGFAGPVDVVSPSGHATTGSLLAAARAATGSSAEFVWVDGEWLTRHGVQVWSELPLWVPEHDPARGLHASDVSLAVSLGLHCRGVEQTLLDTWSSVQDGLTPAWPVAGAVGMDRDVESRLLSQWRAENGQT